MKQILLMVLTGSLFLQSCKPDMKLDEPSAGSANISAPLALGGTLFSGYCNYGLSARGQQHSVAALIGQQLEKAGAPAWTQPLMPDDLGAGINIKYFESPLVQRGRLGYSTDCNNVTDLAPLYDLLSFSAATPYTAKAGTGKFSDMTLPQTESHQWLSASISNPFGASQTNPFFQRFASSPGTTVASDAASLNSTFQMIWPGIDDIYNYARVGGYNSVIPDAVSFENSLNELFSALASSGKTGVLATIPELKVFPFFTYVGARPVPLDAHQADSLNGVTGGLVTYTAGDNGLLVEYPKYSGNYRLSEYGEYFLLSIPSDSLKCQMMGVFYPVPDMYYLDSAEVELINSRVKSYNQVIRKKANELNFALADMEQFFSRFQTAQKIDGVDFSTAFISGGFFSADGFSTTEKANALIANEWIRSINEKYQAKIPFVECLDCQGLKFP